MAEIVGLASSIATLAAAGFHVARKISIVVDDLRVSNAQIKSIAVDTKAVAFILRDIEAKLLSGKESSRELKQDTRDVLAEVLELCRYEIEDLDQNLAPLKQTENQQDTADLRQKEKWLFDKPKIAARQASLDSLKLTLSLLLRNVQLFDMELPAVQIIKDDGRGLEKYMANTTVVLAHPVNGDKAPPAYQATDLYHLREMFNSPLTTLEETENGIAGLSLSEPVDANSHYSTTGTQTLIGPPSKLSGVQEKVKCLAMNKQERRDARRANKAIRVEAWKERKQAKRMAREAWGEERRAVRA